MPSEWKNYEPGYDELEDGLREGGNHNSKRIYATESDIKGIQAKINSVQDSYKHQFDLARWLIWGTVTVYILLVTFTVYTYMRIENRAGKMVAQIEKRMDDIDNRIHDKFLHLDRKILENKEYFHNHIYDIIREINNNSHHNITSHNTDVRKKGNNRNNN